MRKKIVLCLSLLVVLQAVIICIMYSNSRAHKYDFNGTYTLDNRGIVTFSVFTSENKYYIYDYTNYLSMDIYTSQGTYIEINDNTILLIGGQLDHYIISLDDDEQLIIHDYNANKSIYYRISDYPMIAE